LEKRFKIINSTIVYSDFWALVEQEKEILKSIKFYSNKNNIPVEIETTYKITGDKKNLFLLCIKVKKQ
jgi:hypothetical protein